jgi:hypothetical protein
LLPVAAVHRRFSLRADFLFAAASVKLFKWSATKGGKAVWLLNQCRFAKLRDLGERVDAAISEKINARREELETELSRLQR